MGLDRNAITLGSLFDGIGGWCLAAVHAGVQPIWSSEIERFPQEVTKRRFPTVVQLGDITKIDAKKIESVDIICAGSPCQDLSIAGKREGLKGERSGLFRKAVEIVRQMHVQTGGKFPRFFVWENVLGAFSSNKGLDFRTVLEEIGQTEIPMPDGGKWATAGLVQCDKCEIAWRVLDAQYWGVPQRRKRIFLIADFAKTGRCAGEILFEPQGVPRDIAESGNERDRIVGAFGRRIGAARKFLLYDMTHADEVLRIVKGGKCCTLNSRMGTGGNQVPLLYEWTNKKFTKTVRRLTPLECERLQGLPDNWTLINDKSCSDSARYKAIGNGMAQPCADWILKRIMEVAYKGAIT